MANRSLPEPSDQRSFFVYDCIGSWNKDIKILFTFNPAPTIKKEVKFLVFRSKISLTVIKITYR